MAVETPFILSDEHHYALDQIDHLKGCLFITGKAGTGKSTLIQLFRKLSEKKVIFLAPTGVAACLLYTSDAADERSSVDLGGRRIIKKKNIVIKGWGE